MPGYILGVTPVEFTPFPKIGRLNRSIIVTEKIDGTNASVWITEDGRVLAGSRNRFVTPEQDNFGFAKWVKEHEDELRDGLGIGTHYGEWWGSGIQRGYGLDHKRFSLFNVDRWSDDDVRPSCCHVVPVIERYGSFDTYPIERAMAVLNEEGSWAAPGFMRPEGIVVFHPQSRQSFKWTFEGDDTGKGYGK